MDLKISGAALVGRGYKARIRVDVARDQLKRTLDISQSLGMNGKARLNPRKRPATAREATCAAVGKPPSAAPDEAETVEEQIKQARLAQLSLSNAKASEEAAARSEALRQNG